MVRKRAQAVDRGQRRASLRQLAELTGFSITTVSMVLNRRTEFKISSDTRDRILAAAKEHNYQPNLHARSLRTGTTDIVGLTVPTLHNPFFSEMAETFERLARGDRKLALITVTHYDRQEELDTVHYFLSQRVDCVFTANLTALEEVSALCSQAGARQILLDSQESVKHTVSTDNLDAGRTLTRNLLASLAAAGRTGRIYYVGGMAQHVITQQRLEGFKAALRERGLGFTPGQFIPTPFDAEAAYREIRSLFRRRGDVGGLFLNALTPLEGLVRYFPEAADRCRAVHYGVFDYHPIMGLLVDLRLLILKQNPDLMVERAYEIFTADAAAGAGRIHHIPYEVVIAPGMRPFLPDLCTGPAR